MRKPDHADNGSESPEKFDKSVFTVIGFAFVGLLGIPPGVYFGGLTGAIIGFVATITGTLTLVKLKDETSEVVVTALLGALLGALAVNLAAAFIIEVLKANISSLADQQIEKAPFVIMGAFVGVLVGAASGAKAAREMEEKKKR